MEQFKLIHNYLRGFEKACDSKVNNLMSKFCYSSNVPFEILSQICLVGMKQVEDIGNYIGVSMVHSRTPKNLFDMMSPQF